MPFEIINPINYPGWDDLLLTNPDYSFFQSSAWARVLAESYGYKPLYFTIINDGKLESLVPVMEVNSILTGKRGISLPFTDFCEPLLNGNVSFPDLFNNLIEYGKKRSWKYLELRGGQRFFSADHSTLNTQHSGLNTHPAPSCTYFIHNLDLTQGERKIFANLRDSTRRNIKKAQSQGVVIEFSTSRESLNEFCRLNALTRRRHGLPPQPQIFFDNFYEKIIKNDKGVMAIVSYQDRIIGANIFCFLGKKAIYKYGASDLTFQNLRANNLLMWESIRWLSEKKYESLCLGRTELNNHGLRQFKNGWGTEENLLNYFCYNFEKKEFVLINPDLAVWQKWVFSKLPVPILNFLGSILYRYAA